MTFEIENEVEIPFDFDYKKVIQDVILQSLDYENCPYEAEVNVLLTGNDEIHEINLEQRQIDRPTDVLSFPMVDYYTPADFSHLEDGGDIYFHPENTY